VLAAIEGNAGMEAMQSGRRSDVDQFHIGIGAKFFYIEVRIGLGMILLEPFKDVLVEIRHTDDLKTWIAAERRQHIHGGTAEADNT